MNADDPILDEAGTGIYLGGTESPISQSTLQKWRYIGIGPEFVKIGRLVRYRKSALDAYLAGAARRSTSEVA